MTTSLARSIPRRFSPHISLPAAIIQTRVQAAKLLCLGLPLIVCVGVGNARATSKEFTNGSSLTSASNYTPSGTPAPTDNIVIDSGSPTGGAYTLGASLNVEDLSFSLTTTTSIANTSSTTDTLELNGGRGSSVPLIDENSTKTLTFKNGSSGALNLSLGASGTFQIDNSGGLTVSSNIGQVAAGTTLTIAGAGSGVVALSGTNSFSGGLNIIGAEVDVTSDTSLGAAGGSVTINGGRLGISGTFTLDATRSIFLGANPTGGNTTGTLSISGSSSVITIDNALQNLAGSTGDLVKQGKGMLQLGGVSTYTGNTFLNNGITQLVTGNNRLPTGTIINVGQSASSNTGELDLNGYNQQVAGLNSISGAGETTKNIVTTSTGSPTLTLGGSGTYAYGDGTAANSGAITGAISILKTGAGMQTIGDNKTYTGGTVISGGTLVAGTATSGSTVQALGGTSGVVVNASGTLLMGAPNQFNATTPAPLTLNGAAGTANAATFGVNGNSQGSTTANGIGALTLTSGSINNIIDFGDKNGTITLAGLTTNGALLTINHYESNNGMSGGPDELIFDQNEIGNLSNIVFTGYGMSSETSLGSGFYEVFPTAVPEPATVFGGALMLGALGYRQRSRIGQWMASSRAKVRL